MWSTTKPPSILRSANTTCMVTMTLAISTLNECNAISHTRKKIICILGRKIIEYIHVALLKFFMQSDVLFECSRLKDYCHVKNSEICSFVNFLPYSLATVCL